MERISETNVGEDGVTPGLDRSAGTEGLQGVASSDLDFQGSRPLRSSFEREVLQPDSAGKKKDEDQALGKEDRKRSVFEVGKSALIKIEKKAGEIWKHCIIQRIFPSFGSYAKIRLEKLPI